MTNNIFLKFKATKRIIQFSITLFLFASIAAHNMALATPTDALNQDYIENKMNTVLMSDDFIPIIWYEISNYDLTIEIPGAEGWCLGRDRKKNQCSTTARKFGSVRYKYYEQEKGLIVVYFNKSNDIIGYGLDYDADGYGDLQDNDIDGDGVNNDLDDFDYDASEWTDTDGDGVGDNKDVFPYDANETKDSDGDGVGDNSDAFPNDPNESADDNGNGVGDNFEAIPTDLSHKMRAPLKGEFNVADNGAATYTINMELPPGINGTEPDIGFVYSSVQRRGAMRMGWALSGLSSIALCNASKAKDGFIQGVKSDAGERQRFCLDGQPLILVPGGSNNVYGQDGTEYVTELRNNLKIKAIGQTGGGPSHFEVKSGDGKTILYGSVAKSKQQNGCCEFGFGSKVSSKNKENIFVWKMDSISDRNGNKVNYEYHTTSLNSNDRVYSYLSKIRYRGNLEGVNSEVEIDFTWTESLKYNEWETSVIQNSIIKRFSSYTEDYGANATDGFILAERYKLDKVSISLGGHLLKDYRVDYESKQAKGQAPIHNVKSIKECIYGRCTLPIRFAWDGQPQGIPETSQCRKDSDYFAGGEPAFSSIYKTSKPYNNDFGWGSENYYSQILGDYNNDDLTDVAVVYTHKEGSNSRMTVRVSYSEGDGTFSAGGTPYSEIIGGAILNHRLSGDFNNDGYTDLIAMNSSASGWRVYMVLNNGDGSFAAPQYQKVSTGNFIDDKSYRKTTGDFNGDGHLDIMAFGIGHGANKNDVLFSKVSGLVAFVALGNGDGTFAEAHGGRLATRSEIATSFTNMRELFTGDFNGDGITDIAATHFANGSRQFGNPYKGAEIIIAFGTETGNFQKAIIQRWPYTEFPTLWQPTASSNARRAIQTADINGDGLTDIVAMQVFHGGILPAGSENPTGNVASNPDYLRRTIVSMLSNGDGTFIKKVYDDIIPQELRFIGSTLPCESTQHNPTIADFNGDGFSDISFGSTDFLLGRGNGRFLKQGGRFISGDNVKRTGGGLTIYGFGAVDTTYGSYAFDVNRDGTADVVEILVDKNGLKIGSNAYAENVNQQYISQIIDGYGRQFDIEYEEISKNGVYTKGTEATYPYRDIGTGRTVVSRVNISDGHGGSYTLDYQYSGLLADLERKELLSFATMSVSDSRDKTKTTKTYAQIFPLTNRLLKREIHLADNTLINKMETEWRFNKVQHTIGSYDYQWYTLIKKAETTSTFNDTAELIGTVSQVYSKHDIYGRPHNTITTRSDGYETDLTVVLENNDVWENYYVGRMKSSTETKTGPDFAESISRSTTYTYYPDDLLKSETIEPNNADLYMRTNYFYDNYGRVTSLTRSGDAGAQYPVATRTESKIINMPIMGARPRADDVAAFEMEVIMTNAEDHVSKEYIDVRFGHTTRIVDVNQLETIWTYDIYGDLTQEIRPDNTLTSYTRDRCNLHCPKNAVYRIFVQSTGQSFSESYFDIYDRELRKRSIGFNAQTVYQDSLYDLLGRKIYVSEPYFAPGYVSEYSVMSYDDLGRLDGLYTPEEGPTRFQYSGLNGLGVQVIKIQNRSGTNGVTKLTTTQYRNLSDQPVQIKDADNHSTFYKFDAFSNLKRTIDPHGNQINVNYDALGRAVLLSDPDLGQRILGVDAFSQIRFRENAKKQQIVLSYDRLGRLLTREKSEGKDTWVYDNAPNAVGMLISETSASGSRKTLSYDKYSRIEKETHVINNINYVMENDYDFAGRLNKVIYPTGFSVTYGYDSDSGYLQSVYNGNTVYWTATEFNAKGQRLTEDFSNGLSTSTQYNIWTGRIEAIKTGANNALVQNLTFAFDSIGNLEARSDLNQNLAERFDYDNINRLKTVFLNDNLTKQYNYDAIGNILSKSDYATNYYYGQNNAGPHAVTQVTNLGNVKISYDYDENGNMINGDGRLIHYTSFDKPSSLSHAGQTMSFEYDANQNRVRQLKGGDITTYINPRWDTGVHYEKEQSATVTKHKHFINAGNIPIAIYTSFEKNIKPKLHFLHKDHLGSVTAITSENGDIVENLSYQPFGDRRHSDWSDASTELSSNTTHHGFTGHEHLDNVGLIHMNARLYDAKLGRFITADTIIPTKDNLEAFNRYTYVYNNPLSLTDPSGNSPSAGGSLFGRAQALASSAAERAKSIANENYSQAVHNGTVAGLSNSKDSMSSKLSDLAGGVANTFIDALNGIVAAEAARFDSVYESRNLENPIVAPQLERIEYNNETFGQAGEVGAIVAGGVAAAGKILVTATTKVLAKKLPSIRDVNKAGGDTDNCGNCAIATDATLGGNPASALKGGAVYPGVIEKHFGRKFVSFPSLSSIGDAVLDEGKGTRGIIFGSKNSDQMGHYFNVVNQNGKVRFVDGQTGKAADTSRYENFSVLRTN